MRVVLGNPSPRQWVVDNEATGDGHWQAIDGGEQVTTVQIPEGSSLIDALMTITLDGGVWDRHAASPPTWVWSDDPTLATLLADNYGCLLKETLG